MIKLQIYLKDGNVFGYEVENAWKAREHAQKIWETGLRCQTEEDEHTWYGPHWIDKIKWIGEDNSYLAKKYHE